MTGKEPPNPKGNGKSDGNRADEEISDVTPERHHPELPGDVHSFDYTWKGRRYRDFRDGTTLYPPLDITEDDLPEEKPEDKIQDKRPSRQFGGIGPGSIKRNDETYEEYYRRTHRRHPNDPNRKPNGNDKPNGNGGSTPPSRGK